MARKIKTRLQKMQHTTTRTTTHPTPNRHRNQRNMLSCSRPLSSSQTTTPPSRPTRTTQARTNRPGAGQPPHSQPTRQHQADNRTGWQSGDPTACTTPPTRPGNPTKEATDRMTRFPILFQPARTPPRHQRHHDQRASNKRRQTSGTKKLHRKEVIQPHLPVRLPCYDLVPITSLTLDGSAPCGFGHRLRVLPTFMT